jgi:probable aminopeptidase NPEPL1
MSELQIEFVGGVEPLWTAGGNIVVIGHGSAINNRTDLLNAMNQHASFDNQLLQFVQKQANDSAGVISVPIKGNSRFLTVGVLSEACSRHNAHGRPDLVPVILDKSPEKSAVAHIHFVFDDEKFVFGAGVGVAKAFLMYNAKKQADSSADQMAGKKIVVSFDAPKNSLLDSHISMLNGLYSSVRRAARLVDSPTCEVGIDAMINEAQKVCDNLKSLKHVQQSKAEVSINVIRGEKLRDEGFGGIYGVGKGAADPPAFVHLSYKPSSKATERIAMVGKGIVYDSGGLALKTAEGMFTMKIDMGKFLYFDY